MKYFDWPIEKNIKLQLERDISFEMVVWHIQNGNILDIIDHPNKIRYPNQKMFIIQIEQYVYCIPFIETEATVFLKTIFPSRKLTIQYLGEQL